MKKILAISIILMLSLVLFISGCTTPQTGKAINTSKEAQSAEANIEKDLTDAGSLLDDTIGKEA